MKDLIHKVLSEATVSRLPFLNYYWLSFPELTCKNKLQVYSVVIEWKLQYIFQMNPKIEIHSLSNVPER